MPKIKNVTYVGKRQTYDLEIDHPDHQFMLSNGLLTSNSHAVSYAVDSYQCAWLLTYFEAEWLCAYMESQTTSPDARGSALAELKSFGYEIVSVDINYAMSKWTILKDKKFMPSFLTVKGVGAAAIEEIEANRPYKTVDDLLWNEDGSWKHSKFNKRALENLIKIRAFESMGIVGEGKTFPSYKAMHACLIDEQHKLKHKKTGKAELKSRIEACKNMQEWTQLELVTMSKELVGSFDINLIAPQKIRDKLTQLSVPSIDEYDVTKRQNICWFIIENAVQKMSKNGKPYMLLSVVGSVGKLHRVYVWAWSDKYEIDFSSLQLAELSKSDFGFSTMSFKMKSARQKKKQ